MGEGDGVANGIVVRSVLIETQQDFTAALERLRRRDPEALAAFILSLAEEVCGMDLPRFSGQVVVLFGGCDLSNVRESAVCRVQRQKLRVFSLA